LDDELTEVGAELTLGVGVEIVAWAAEVEGASEALALVAGAEAVDVPGIV
jgi:hypothetical protein